MTIPDTAAPVAKAELALPGAEHRAALAVVEADLWALDGASVERPIGNPAELVSEALLVATARAAERHGEGLLARVELLALALWELQVRYLYLPAPPLLEPMAALKIGNRVRHVERAAAKLVAAGILAADDIPVATGSSWLDRAARASALIRVFRVRRAPVDFSASRAAADVENVRRYGAESPRSLAVTELRDRGYTALREALAYVADDDVASDDVASDDVASDDVACDDEPVSGVFAARSITPASEPLRRVGS